MQDFIPMNISAFTVLMLNIYRLSTSLLELIICTNWVKSAYTTPYTTHMSLFFVIIINPLFFTVPAVPLLLFTVLQRILGGFTRTLNTTKKCFFFLGNIKQYSQYLLLLTFVLNMRILRFWVGVLMVAKSWQWAGISKDRFIRGLNLWPTFQPNPLILRKTYFI